MKILIAEDDVVSAKLLEVSLKQWGHQVTVAFDGKQALTEYTRSAYDVVVTDWMMPEIDGIELAKQIREVRGREYPWVILLTTKVFKDNYVNAMESGIDDFLTKPLDRELLRVRLFVAARVQKARRQVAELSRLLPICMHCKAVKSSPEDGWRRVEEFLSKHSDVSHGYCPDCYWDKSVSPDLGAFLHERGRPPAPAPDVAVDQSALAALEEFDRKRVPGIAEDARIGFRELAVSRMKADIDAASMGTRLTPLVIARYRQAADALGATRLASLFEKLGSHPYESAALVRAELARVLRALFPSESPPPPPDTTSSPT